MAHSAMKLLATPIACDQTTEYDNRIANEVDVEPDDENDGIEPQKNSAEIEQRFARYECNYRARRIRELTLAPVKKKKGARRTADAVAI